MPLASSPMKPVHETQHPESFLIDSEGSEEWIRKYAEAQGISYGFIMLAARTLLGSGQMSIVKEQNWLPNHRQQQHNTFWMHYERVTFTRVPERFKTRFLVYIHP